MITVDHLTETQRKVLRIVARDPTYNRQLAGHGMAPMLSAARALVRKGIMRSWRTGHYIIVDEYRGMADAELARWRAERAAQQGGEVSNES